ncbi:MAG: YfhO family protein, partial [Patescibacteria group bacterium]|nr:YfhO family protein [Patescibacteria group bacterium]
SHNAVSIMIIPVLLLLFGYFILTIKHKRKFAMHIIFFGLYGAGLSAFFLLPAFFEGKYTLRDIVTKGEIHQRMVDPLSFVIPVWNYGGGNEFTKHLGFSIFFLFVLSFFIRKKILVFLWAIFFLYLFLMTSPSSFIWERLSILQKFQFPWRLLVMTTFIGALIGGIVIRGLQKQQRIFLLIALSLLSIFSTIHMWRPKAYIVYDESFFTGIYKSTTDTGESSPIWSVRFMEFSPNSAIEIAEGKAVVTKVSRTTTSREYLINAETKTRLVENTLYFPGWEVFVNNRKTDIQFQDPQWRGRMTFWVDEGTHTVRILFRDTKVRMISNIISLVSIGCLFPLLYLVRR